MTGSCERVGEAEPLPDPPRDVEVEVRVFPDDVKEQLLAIFTGFSAYHARDLSLGGSRFPPDGGTFYPASPFCGEVSFPPDAAQSTARARLHSVRRHRTLLVLRRSGDRRVGGQRPDRYRLRRRGSHLLPPRRRQRLW